MKSPIKYSIIVPAFREEAIIEQALESLLESLRADTARWKSTEVIVVTADPQSDATAKIAQSFQDKFGQFLLITPKSKVGKGRDVRLGMLAARGDYILFTDADMATPPRHIKQMFTLLEAGNDVVIGVRPLKRVHNTFARRARSVVSNMLICVLAVPGVPDTQCGFKGFSKKATQELFEPLETTQWGFDIEILVRARSSGYKIAKMVISDWHDPKIGVLGLAGESDLHANWSTLKELLSIAKKRFTGYYKSNK